MNILIDMIKLRDAMVESSALTLPEATFYPSFNNNGLKTIRELAIFRFTCRKCADAPCIGVCPAEALEKDEEGFISRALNLCISCKSCVTICPFGTMMTDFFEFKRDKSIFFDLTSDEEIEKFIKSSLPGIVSFVDMEENQDEHIYKLNEKVLIKEYLWDYNKL